MKLLITFFVCIAFATSEFISDDSFVLTNDANVSYVLGTQKVSWDNAYVLCRQSGMELASVTTEADESAIENYLKTYSIQAGMFEGFWLAGTRYGALSSDFVWFTTGNPMVYRKFAQGQPDNAGGSEYCLEIFLNDGNNRYEWNDANCTLTMRFLCQTSKCSR